MGSTAASLLSLAIALNAIGRAPQRPLDPIPSAYQGRWLALLHYWPHGDRWRSEVEDTTFFLTSQGRENPVAEWNAILNAFKKPLGDGNPDAHAQCRFPARFWLMRRAMQWSDADVPVIRCPGFEAFRARIDARSLQVVFASYYVGNPASAFGHVMLYLGTGTDHRSELADYTVSFEADVSGMSPTQYLPRGLFHGLTAEYRIDPLYTRVSKYVNREERDLWFFPLHVKGDVVANLVRHLWELRDIRFQYGFFRGNCAQELLALVHAVAPSYGLLPYRSTAVLPAEVARRFVERVGLLGDPILRPSELRQLATAVAGLDADERRQLDQMIKTRSVVRDATPRALAAATLWGQLRSPYGAFRREADSVVSKDAVWWRALWAARVEAGDSDEATRPKIRKPLSCTVLESMIYFRGLHQTEEGGHGPQCGIAICPVC